MLSHKTRIDLIGASFGWGAQERGTEFGPEAVREGSLCDSLKKQGWETHWKALTPSQSSREMSVSVGPKTLPLLEDFLTSLSSEVLTSLQREAIPFVIGGDHSIAVATWSALHTFFQDVSFQRGEGYDPSKNMGLIWIDAHLDAHTPATTPSKAYHGMPLASLLGHGEASLVNHGRTGAKLAPGATVILGARSWEPEEHALLHDLGVRLYTMTEIQQRGFQACFEEAAALVEKKTEAYGLSFDLDAFDPCVAPGVGSPAPGGLQKEEVLKTLSGFALNPCVKIIEIVELNPEKDVNAVTARLVEELIYTLLREGESK